MVDIRRAILLEHAEGKDVVDLCCGSGAYLLPILANVKSAIAIDFSTTMLQDLRQRLGKTPSARIRLIEADATALPVSSSSIDYLYAFTALYYVQRLDLTIQEVSRLLRPRGVATLEVGNVASLNTIVANAFSSELGWAKPHHVALPLLRAWLSSANLEVVGWRSFQLSPMYGAPRSKAWLYPLVHPAWKRVMGIEANGRMLDEWISSSSPLQRFAFRHLITVRKK